MFRRSRNPAYTDDDPPIVRSLRYATEPPPPPLGSVLTGGVAQSLIVALFVFGGIELPETAPERPHHPHAKPLFFPARNRQPVAPAPPERRTVASKMAAPKVPEAKILAPNLPEPKGRVDMNTIEISIVEDTANQLPEVVRQQQGVLALVERDDQSIAHFTFEPPDWRMSDRIVDVSGRIRFSMSPPSRWELLRSLADRHSIDMEKYEVNALFDSAYESCVEREIRDSASRMPNAGRVRAAVLIFTSARSCGIDVVKLEFANQ